MCAKRNRIFMGDFETTVYDNQEYTEVWASACVELGTEDVKIFHSIDEQFEYFVSLKTKVICYYHNLKFDGAFWLYFLLNKLNLKQASIKTGNEVYNVKWQRTKEMENNSFRYLISNMGQWYTIIIKYNNKIIELRDSLKLLPFSVKRIGESFGTKHKKLDMEYEGYRYAGCEITDEEKEYIANDVLVVKEALEIMFAQGHDKLTIGANCLAEYKQLMFGDYETYFPNLYEQQIDATKYQYDNAGEYIRRSYKGGWCYLVEGKENQIKNNGTTADVNSLYPSMMSSESGNRYPVGHATFWKGNIPKFLLEDLELGNKGMYYFFIRIRTRFKIKDGKLPFIQIKNNISYKGNECLKTSSPYFDGQYWDYIPDLFGELKPTTVELTLTMTDYILFREHYNVFDFEVLDGCWFFAEIGIFDTYIEKYKKIKLESKGALRELAKLFLNNLYGKMASSTISSFKYAYQKDDGTIGFFPVPEYEKIPGYIPVGSAITSYARNFTIRAAQANFYGADKKGFIYADTDSIHCDLAPEEIKGITVHPKNFCCWKLESCWDIAFFSRQKTYIEHIVKEDCEEIVEPYYNIKCAGMPDKCKNLFEKNLSGFIPAEDDKDYTNEEREFLQTKRTINDFTLGLKIPGKLVQNQIKGGVILKETTYEMR